MRINLNAEIGAVLSYACLVGGRIKLISYCLPFSPDLGNKR
jgi:hypothetical protein